RIDDDTEDGGRHSGVSRAPDALIGTVIDRRYRVDALLGEGGMGLVYRVTHTELDKTLAIKVLRSANTRDEEVLTRFRREAQSASNIGNEHIVDIIDFGTLPDGSTYFVMECLEGLDLIDTIDAAQRLPEGRAIHIARQICHALAAAHDAGIVHRDLKPENVFLIRRGDDQDFVKVLDFGIAKVANRPHRLTRDGEVLGTPHYMSPEQCAGGDVDHRTDIYALGVLLYEMVTGHVPHDADTMMGILTKQMYEDPVSPTMRVSKLSEQLERIIMRSLEKKPAQRYQTMHEMEAELSRLDIGQMPVGSDAITLRVQGGPKRKQRRKAALFLVGLITLAIVALAAVRGVFDSAEEELRGLATPTFTMVDVPPSEPVESEQLPTPPEVAETDGADTIPNATSARPKQERAKRKPRSKPKPSELGGQDEGPILDPWK
ncbi:MAG: protein kinase, partial [Myxococcales bacterium]|nr:protein kinase [Myxococcales bacterium]